ncbi:CocE/NonD family hydrolase [Pseudonocardiaceae bacterium YIM PH 21723]|nr:CocE/NonD family hydrolase [Pseudonocardiaceae bacterium YIM PH 21723]
MGRGADLVRRAHPRRPAAGPRRVRRTVRCSVARPARIGRPRGPFGDSANSAGHNFVTCAIALCLVTGESDRHRTPEQSGRWPMRKLSTLVAALLMLAAGLPGTAAADASALPDKPARYGVGVQRDVPVTMRDGVVLKVDVYYPTVPGGKDRVPGPFPVLVTQIPYGKWLPMNTAGRFAPNIDTGAPEYFVRRGYIEVVSDVRGSGASGGEFEFFGEKQTLDGVDLVNWSAKLPNSTGTVGTYGLSYMGMNQLFTGANIGKDSPLKAMIPGAAATDWFRDVAVMGGLSHLPAVATLLGWVPNQAAASALLNAGWDQLHGGQVDYPAALQRFADHLRTATGYIPPLLQDLISGTGDRNFDGEFWKAFAPGDQVRQVVDNGIPALMYSGWLDVMQRGALQNYAAFQNAATGRPIHAPMTPGQPVTGRYQLIYGPGDHLNPTGPLDLLRIELAWFDRWLKNEHNGIDETQTPLHLNVDHTDQWISTATYPLAAEDPARYYLNHGGLSATPGKPGSDSLAYSPFNVGCGRGVRQWSIGTAALPTNVLGGEALTKAVDQCSRDDQISQIGALTYTTAPLAEDRMLAGPMSATVKATATTTNTAFLVTVQDISPDGSSLMLTRGGLDGRQRDLNPGRTWQAANGAVVLPYRDHTAASERPVSPGELTEYVVEVYPALARIKSGHRIRVTIGTADFPMTLPSLKQYSELAGGKYRLQLGGESFVDLPLVSPGAMPHRCAVICTYRGA